MQNLIKGFVVLFIITPMIISCGHNENNKQLNFKEVETSEGTLDYISDHPHKNYPFKPYIETDFSVFNENGAVIVEWGEIINDEQGKPLKFIEKNNGLEYILIGINYLKFFEATSEKDKSILSRMYKLFVDDPDDPIRFDIIDSDRKEAVADLYDDVIAICSDYADDVIKRKTDILIDCYTLTLSNEDKETVWFTPEKYSDTDGRPVLISVNEGVIQYENAFFEKFTYDTDEHYKCYSAGCIAKANDYLIKLGLNNKIFRNGMTIEELEEYFNLVTNKETFAPLFENTSSSDTP